MAPTANELRKQLEVAELEEQFVAAKGKGGGPKRGTDEGEYRQRKLELRKARQKAREARAREQAGDGEARPEPVRAEAEAQDAGG